MFATIIKKLTNIIRLLEYPKKIIAGRVANSFKTVLQPIAICNLWFMILMDGYQDIIKATVLI